jgi:branched-chain amino acid transport system substrate-binding protein
MPTSRLRQIVALFLILTVFAAACGRDDSSSSSDTTSGTAATGDTTGGDGTAAGPADSADCESYDGTRGVTDDAIKIGSSFPQSGLFAAFSQISEGYKAQFGTVNDDGGIRGRKIDFTSLDDEYQAGNTLSNYESLEADGVFALFNVVGTANNLAIRDLQNEQCVPSLYLATGSQFWGDPAQYPWTIGSLPTYPTEMASLVDYLGENNPTAKVAVLYQNDDFGKGYLDALKALIEGTDITIVADTSYDPTDNDVSSQITTLSGSDADLLVLATTALACPTSLGALQESGWTQQAYISATCTSSTLVGLAPEGSADGVLSAFYLKDPRDPQWDDDAGMVAFQEDGAAQGLDAEQLDNGIVVYGWTMGELLTHTLTEADDLTRVDVMNQSWHLDNVELSLLLPGITANTDGADDPYVIEQMRIGTYNGEFWDLGDKLYDFEGQSGEFSPES